jgi:hypothetical protein
MMGHQADNGIAILAPKTQRRVLKGDCGPFQGEGCPLTKVTSIGTLSDTMVAAPIIRSYGRTLIQGRTYLLMTPKCGLSILSTATLRRTSKSRGVLPYISGPRRSLRARELELSWRKRIIFSSNLRTSRTQKMSSHLFLSQSVAAKLFTLRCSQSILKFKLSPKLASHETLGTKS